MDISPQDGTTQPISDDQDLAKALAGVLPDEPELARAPSLPGIPYEETAGPSLAAAMPGISPAAPVLAPAPVIAPAPAIAPLPTPTMAPTANSALDNIKRTALGELRPLIDKVELPVQEKFDTYLMLIRSTDDASLIPPAHAAAQAITDEKKRAEALLEIIKEIDYLSRKAQPDA